MKKSAFALAALVAFSGSALAGEAAKGKHAPAAPACVEKTVKLDCAPTGSVARPAPAQETGTAGKGPRLGIDIDPWIMPNTF